MVVTIGKNTNISTEPTVDDGVEITGNVAVTAVSENLQRVRVIITIDVADAFIRMMPAATDNSVRKGILVRAGMTWEMEEGTEYPGEISIINAKNNRKPVFYVTQL